MNTEEVSDSFVASCFVNGLEAYDGEINLGVEENMISNEYAVKLCLEHEVKRGNKIVKKELIVELRGEIYFLKFIINPDEDDVKPGVIFKRSFLRMIKAITDFGAKTITIYPYIDSFLKDTEKEEKSMDDWDQFLDFNLDDIPLLGGEELMPFVCKRRKSRRNKKRVMENLNLFYQQDIGTSSSIGRHLTQEEAAKETLAIRISQKFELLKEVRPVLETMAYHDKYKKVLDEIWKYKVELDGMIVKDKEEAIKRLKLRREEIKKVERWITMINHTQAEAMGIPTNVLWIPAYDWWHSQYPERIFSTFDGFCHQTFCVARFDVMRNAKSDNNDEEEYEIKRNKEETMLKPDHRDPNAIDNLKPWKKCCFHKFTMNSLLWGGHNNEAKSRDLDTTTLRELIDSEDRLIPKDPQSGVSRFGIPRPPRASIAPLQGAYNAPGYAQLQYDQYYQQCPPPPS
uniref:Uncharacterized protein n=1 Tax=Tanacetum cinerariifolium TaxID=118510 RepID=A0A6L2J4N1_TANCI|nr:hypothetical protein [Tanacetum cinerariifolium]